MADFEVLRDVIMTTIFGTNIAIIGVVWTIATRLLDTMEGVEWSANKMQILPISCD